MVRRVTTNDNEWQRVIQPATTSDKTSDKKWYNEYQRVLQRVTTNDNEWYNEWKRMKTNENKWEQVKESVIFGLERNEIWNVQLQYIQECKLFINWEIEVFLSC